MFGALFAAALPGLPYRGQGSTAPNGSALGLVSRVRFPGRRQRLRGQDGRHRGRNHLRRTLVDVVVVAVVVATLLVELSRTTHELVVAVLDPQAEAQRKGPRRRKHVEPLLGRQLRGRWNRRGWGNYRDSRTNAGSGVRQTLDVPRQLGVKVLQADLEPLERGPLHRQHRPAVGYYCEPGGRHEIISFLKTQCKTTSRYSQLIWTVDRLR